VTVRAALTALTALTAVTARPALAQLDAGIAIGTKATPVTIADLDGSPVDLGKVIGTKPVLLQFWATWCSLCKALVPRLQAVQDTFGDRIELIGINVTVNDSRERVRRYVAEHKPPFRVLYDDKGVGARAFDVPTTSFIVILNAAGEVAYTGTGGRQDLVGAVRKVLEPGR
jgi:thiol-disulfide isomerase/thioredoxin